MKKLIIFFLAFFSVLGIAYAGSTINPTLPANGVPYQASVIRNNFADAYHDVNAILQKYGSPTAPASPTQFQEWINTTSLPYPWNIYDGAEWLQLATINPSTHNLTVTAGVVGGITLTGDVTGSGTLTSPVATTVAQGVVPVSRLANIPAVSVVGNATNASASPSTIASGGNNYFLKSASNNSSLAWFDLFGSNNTFTGANTFTGFTTFNNDWKTTPSQAYATPTSPASAYITTHTGNGSTNGGAFLEFVSPFATTGKGVFTLGLNNSSATPVNGAFLAASYNGTTPYPFLSAESNGTNGYASVTIGGHTLVSGTPVAPGSGSNSAIQLTGNGIYNYVTPASSFILTDFTNTINTRTFFGGIKIFTGISTTYPSNLALYTNINNAGVSTGGSNATGLIAIGNLGTYYPAIVWNQTQGQGGAVSGDSVWMMGNPNTNTTPDLVIAASADTPAWSANAGTRALQIKRASTLITEIDIGNTTSQPAIVLNGDTMPKALVNAPVSSKIETGTLQDRALGAENSTTIVLPGTSSATNNYYRTYTASITAGTGIGQSATISQYDGTSKIATVSTAFTPDTAHAETLLTPNLTSTGTSATSFTLGATASAVASAYVNNYLTVTAGSGTGQSVPISAYTTGRVATTSAFTLDTANGHTYTSDTGLQTTGVSQTSFTLATSAGTSASQYNNWYLVFTSGTGAYSLTVKSSASGSVGISMQKGSFIPLVCDGVDVLTESVPSSLFNGALTAYTIGVDRVNGATYYNTNPLPIMVYIGYRMGVGAGGSGTITVNGVNILNQADSSAVNGQNRFASFVVPAGGSYRANMTGDYSLSTWAEQA